MTNETCHQGVGYHNSDPSDKVRGRLHSRRHGRTSLNSFIWEKNTDDSVVIIPTSIINIEIDQNCIAN